MDLLESIAIYSTSDIMSITLTDLPVVPRSIDPDPGGYCEQFDTRDCTGNLMRYLDNNDKL
jgi:hypothetical protein